MSEQKELEQNIEAEQIPEEESFEKLFEASLQEQPEVRRGEMVGGKVINIQGDLVIVDVGAKAEATIPAEEFGRAGLPLPSPGDKIEALVQSVGRSGEIRLSVFEGVRREAWKAVEQALSDETPIDAEVIRTCKGGYRVSIGALEAFMPRSEADPNPRLGASEIVGKPCKVVVLEARRKPENIVVSRKRPLEAEREAMRKAFFAKASLGDKVTGVVRRLTDFGAFVDVSGVDALLHVSELSWRRIEDPSEVLSEGQTITAEIIKLNPETGKVSLSMKTLQPDPWEKAAQVYEPGMRLTGTVRKLLDFGAVVELEPGIEGLIHRSEMSWTRKDVKPSQVLTEGDVVDVAVLEVDAESRRLRLSLKAVTENPWQQWLAQHPVGSHVTGKIRNITEFGFFVAVSKELDGLVHVDNLSWDRPGQEVLAEYRKGQEVECVVLGVDVERQRISLGIKQLDQDPFELFLAEVKRGASVTGEVIEMTPRGAMVKLAEGVHAHLSMREVPREHEEIKVGSQIEAKVIDVQRKRRLVELSIRQHLRDEERNAVRQYSQKVKEDKTPSALALELQRKLLNKK